jgi:hypothetical protein
VHLWGTLMNHFHPPFPEASLSFTEAQTWDVWTVTWGSWYNADSGVADLGWAWDSNRCQDEVTARLLVHRFQSLYLCLPSPTWVHSIQQKSGGGCSHSLLASLPCLNTSETYLASRIVRSLSLAKTSRIWPIPTPDSLTGHIFRLFGSYLLNTSSYSRYCARHRG